MSFPHGSCDTHLHFYDGSFPTAPRAVLQPPDATVDEYRLVQAELGLTRAVVVQPTTYGFDNRVQLAALNKLGANGRGVLVVDSSTSTAELEHFHACGVRGARFHLLPGGAVEVHELEPTAQAIHDFGWHIQAQFDGNRLPEFVERFAALPCPVVLDHVGRFMPPPSPDAEAFVQLLKLIDTGRCWVKLSAPYEGSAEPPPHPDVVTLIDRLIAAAPERLLWASNWPHPGQALPPTPAVLQGWMERWIPAQHRQTILVSNPAELYGFPTTESEQP